MIEQINKATENRIRELLINNFELKIKGQFFAMGKNKIWWFNQNISKTFLINILKNCRAECLGLYFCNLDNNELRLSMDAAIMLGKNAKKNILELNDEQTTEYLKGNDIDFSGKEEGYYILKSKKDFIGCGKIKGNRLWNYIPKDRRLK